MAMNKPARLPRVPRFLRYGNRLVRTIAGRRVYGLLRHQGRKSGKRYETPVMAWQTPRGLLVPLSWGTKSDWYRNLAAAQGCDVQVGGHWYHCTEPVLIQRDEARSLLPTLPRIILSLVPVPQFVLLRRVDKQA
jgi:deazaflavin-dependent oxidoreductase (nitroreductase family)